MRTPKYTLLILFLTAGLCAASARLEKAYFELAQAFDQQGAGDAALEHYKKTLECNPDNIEALFKIGCLSYQFDAYEDAVQAFEKRLKLNPSCAHSEFGLARSFSALKKIDEAIEHYRKAVQLNPKLGAIYEELGNALARTNKIDEAITAYQQAFALGHKKKQMMKQLLYLFTGQQNYKEALVCCNKLLSVEHGSAHLIMKKCKLLTKLDRTDEALTIYKAILSLEPNNPFVLCSIAHAYKRLGNMTEAIESYKEAIERDPNNRNAHLGLAHALLHQGEYEAGWEVLDQWNRLTYSQYKQEISLENVCEKTVLIGGEWQHQDVILLLRYVKKIKELGATVALQTPSALEPIVRRCPYIDSVVVMNRDRSCPHHVYIPISSLPSLFPADETMFSSDIPYLCANDAAVRYWASRLPVNENIRVGIHLYKGQEPEISSLLSLATISGVDIYLLSTLEPEKDLHNRPDNELIHLVGNGFTENKNDLEQLAAIIQNLDIVITGDSTIAHLAGALNIPTWILLPHVASWQWQAERKDSPWYPSVQLFRQPQKGDWISVVDNVTQKLIQTSNAQHS